jgi:predicted TIM-barrel fold metal-dependent hydrolase
MARLPFVDTHVHFWDLNHPDLHYAWLQPDVVHPVIGDIDAIKFPLYSSEQFLAETAESNVSEVIHVEADVSGDDDPVSETIWLQQAAERTGIPTAIIADINLKSPDVAEQIERHCNASPRLRGVRDFSEGDYLVDSDFARGYALLGQHGLVCGLDCVAENMPKARDLARKHPETMVVLDHAGYPRERTPEYFAFCYRSTASADGNDSGNGPQGFQSISGGKNSENCCGYPTAAERGRYQFQRPSASKILPHAALGLPASLSGSLSEKRKV